MPIDPKYIRNFSIIAHIDHGKSTLSDRILELTETVSSRDMKEQLLDSMDIERERGITIKSQAVRVDYRAEDGELYHFNLIDTPGHVDFTYEVSRSLAACEGAVLVVDATQGVEAQTVANAMMAMNANLEIIPLINKIDLPAAEPERVKAEIEDGLAIPADDAVLASGKTGEGVHDLLEAVVYNIPAPTGNGEAPLRALIFDSYFDAYRGVVALIRVVDGHIKKGDKIRMMATGTETLVEEVGARHPQEVPEEALYVGEVGYLVTGLKDVSQVKVGDTITLQDDDGNQAQLTITDICENYIYHYVYISPKTYEEAFGKEMEANSLLCKLPEDLTAQEEERLGTDLLQCRDVVSAQFTDTLSESFHNSITSINSIIVVLIVSAGLLAFVVLYNLTNINITEREKELATIKVLGFYDGEVSAYIYRETVLLTLIGTALGLLLGMGLHQFVIRTAEVDMVMFGRAVYWPSYVYSAVLTILFGMLVNLVMHHKLKKISMVESMKAPE